MISHHHQHVYIFTDDLYVNFASLFYSLNNINCVYIYRWSLKSNIWIFYCIIHIILHFIAQYKYALMHICIYLSNIDNNVFRCQMNDSSNKHFYFFFLSFFFFFFSCTINERTSRQKKIVRVCVC
jgi:hypothetical protein